MPLTWVIRHYEGKQPDWVFYESYDTGFFTAKSSVLATLAEHYEKAQTLFAQYGLNLEDKDKARFKLDVYFSEFQCFEALFALMMAPFQLEPHCIYMCQYQPRKLKEQVNAYLRADIASITMGKLHSQTEFLDESVYSRFRPNDSSVTWPENLSSLEWLFDRLARRYIDALEYNFHKHGLRVSHNGPSTLGISSMDDDAPTMTWESEDSIRFLRLDGNALSEETKYFDVGESLFNLYIMEAMLDSIRATRLARLTPELQEFTVKDFRGIGREHVNRFRAKDFKFSIKLGEKEM